jgi:hypothetical protein
VTVEFGGLSKDENDLIKVAKYFHDNHSEFERVVVKMVKVLNLDAASVSHMTGISPQQVRGIVRRVGFTAEFMQPKKAKALKNVDAVAENYQPENRRLAIHVNANSDIPQRVAHDMAAIIHRDMNPGDKWLSAKEAMAQFQCTAKTVTIANQILIDHNWIEMTEPGNFRKGYKVK